jgi:hypothetical protein
VFAASCVRTRVVERYPDPAYLPRLREAIDAARTAEVPVIYVVVGFRPGFSEVSPRNKMSTGVELSISWLTVRLTA